MTLNNFWIYQFIILIIDERWGTYLKSTPFGRWLVIFHIIFCTTLFKKYSGFFIISFSKKPEQSWTWSRVIVPGGLWLFRFVRDWVSGIRFRLGFPTNALNIMFRVLKYCLQKNRTCFGLFGPCPFLSFRLSTASILIFYRWRWAFKSYGFTNQVVFPLNKLFYFYIYAILYLCELHYFSCVIKKISNWFKIFRSYSLSSCYL